MSPRRLLQLISAVSLFAAALAVSSPARADGNCGAGQQSAGSCSIPAPVVKKTDGSIDTNFSGKIACMDFYGAKFTSAIITKSCSGDNAPSQSACPTANVILTCSKTTSAGLIVIHYYAVPGAASDVYARKYNEKKVKGGCKAPWTKC